jgi:uncharacterized membrane protein YgdD (TMEM256/DUF423 family)
VVVGAFGAHALRGLLDTDEALLFETATRYMMIHGFALLALGLWSHWEKWAQSFWAGFFFVFGILLFSGSLYAMISVKAQWVAYLTPAGGIFFILGWLNFMFSIFTTKNKFV